MIPLSIAQVLLCLAAFLIGVLFFAVKKSPLYFRLLFYGVACFLLEELYYLTDYACSGVWPSTFSFASFGAGAGYAFFLSANYGQFDGFVDDGSAGCRRAGKLAVLAPALLAALYIPAGVHFFRSDGSLSYFLLTFTCKLPAFFAAYFHMKHLILPDAMHFMVDPLRPCNAVCLLLILSDVLSDVFLLFSNVLAGAVCGTVAAASLIVMMLMAERGRRGWSS